MTTPLLGDSSDRQIELAKAKRINGGTIPEWIDWLTRNPDATLPAGVGGALVAHFEHELAVRDSRDGYDHEQAEKITRFLSENFPMQAGRGAGDVIVEILTEREPSPEYLAALKWHENGKHVSPAAPSVMAVEAILAHYRR